MAKKNGRAIPFRAEEEWEDIYVHEQTQIGSGACYCGWDGNGDKGCDCFNNLIEYNTILADPPWNERGGGKIKRGADRHYPLLKTPDIITTIEDGISEMGVLADNAHLYLWVTNNHLKDGLTVMDALGFRYITNICWVKDRFGLGQYFRGQHELLLFGVKGRLLSRTKSQTTVIQEKRRRHSQKPAATYSKIEAVSPPPYLELFAREPREGWSAWGNEVEPTLQVVLK